MFYVLNLIAALHARIQRDDENDPGERETGEPTQDIHVRLGRFVERPRVVSEVASAPPGNGERHGKTDRRRDDEAENDPHFAPPCHPMRLAPPDGFTHSR